MSIASLLIHQCYIQTQQTSKSATMGVAVMWIAKQSYTLPGDLGLGQIDDEGYCVWQSVDDAGGSWTIGGDGSGTWTITVDSSYGSWTGTKSGTVDTVAGDTPEGNYVRTAGSDLTAQRSVWIAAGCLPLFPYGSDNVPQNVCSDTPEALYASYLISPATISTLNTAQPVLFIPCRATDPAPSEAMTIYGRFDANTQKVFYFDHELSLTVKDRIVWCGAAYTVFATPQNQGGNLNRLWKVYCTRKAV